MSQNAKLLTSCEIRELDKKHHFQLAADETYIALDRSGGVAGVAIEHPEKSTDSRSRRNTNSVYLKGIISAGKTADVNGLSAKDAFARLPEAVELRRQGYSPIMTFSGQGAKVQDPTRVSYHERHKQLAAAQQARCPR